MSFALPTRLRKMMKIIMICIHDLLYLPIPFTQYVNYEMKLLEIGE